MYKDFHNRIRNLPGGPPANPWVNVFWMLVFSPFFIGLGAVAVVGLWAIFDVAFRKFFG